MQRAIGGILSLGGLGALIYFLIKYMQNSGSASVAGVQVAQSHGSILPIIISAVVMVIGVIILMTGRDK